MVIIFATFVRGFGSEFPATAMLLVFNVPWLHTQELGNIKRGSVHE